MSLLVVADMVRLKSGYSEYRLDDLFHLGGTVSTNTTGKPIWAPLKPTSAELQAATDAFENARNMVGKGRKQAVAATRGALSGLLGDVAVNAPQVTGVTDTDLAELGIPLLKTPVRTTTLPEECQNFVLFHGELPGEVIGKCDPLGRAVRSYEAQWALDPNGTWSEPVSFPNSRAFKYSDLARGKDVWVRVRGRNINGTGPWSTPGTIMVI